MPRGAADCYASRMGRALLRDGDVISGAVLSALGVFIFLQAHQWTYTGPDGPGPGFFPTWYGLGMVALSLVMIGQKIARGIEARTAVGLAAAFHLVFAVALDVALPTGWLGF